LIIALLLILVVVVAYNPRAREAVIETWETIRPALVELLDTVYATIRDLITGNDSNDRMDETPTPDSPGVNFDRIVTMNSGFS